MTTNEFSQVDAGTQASTRRERTGWYFYDWANSAFSTTVLTVFLGPFLTTGNTGIRAGNWGAAR